MIERLSPMARNLLLAGIGLLLVVFFWTVRSVLNPLIAGYFLAYAIHPMVAHLQRRGLSRAKAVNTIFVLFFFAVLLTLVGLALQARQLAGNVHKMRDDVEQSLDEWVKENPETVDWMLEILGEGEGEESDSSSTEDESATEKPPAPGDTAVPVEEDVQDVAASKPPRSLSQVLERIGEQLFSGEHAAETGRVGLAAAEEGWAFVRKLFGTGFALATFFFLLPLYTWFLLFELDRIHSFVRRYLPRRDRERLALIGGQIGEVISNFFRGRLLVSLIKGLITTLGLYLVGVDYALLIGMGAGLLSLVPFIGPVTAALVAFLVSVTEPGHSLVYALLSVGGAFAVAEILEGYVLIPKILGNSLGLHPVVVLISVFVGGAAFGVLGMLIAIPLTASLVILARELVLPALAQFADEGS